jgi:hypothetical protein
MPMISPMLVNDRDGHATPAGGPLPPGLSQGRGSPPWTLHRPGLAGRRRSDLSDDVRDGAAEDFGDAPVLLEGAALALVEHAPQLVADLP